MPRHDSPDLTAAIDAMSAHPIDKWVGDGWDPYDPWGSAMSIGFAVCDYLTFELDRPEMVPADLAYAPSICGPDEECSEWESLAGCPDSLATPESLHNYLLSVNAVLDACLAHGLDY